MSHATQPQLQTYDHHGVQVSDIPSDQKASGFMSDTTKANDHRAGAEAIAPMYNAQNNHSSSSHSDTPTQHPTPQQSPPAAGGGGGGPPKLDKFAYTFLSPEIAFFRKIVFKILGSGTMLTIVVMWLALPMYWGSLWLSNIYTNNLGVRIVDYDGGVLGNAVTQGLMTRTDQLGYFTSTAAEFPDRQAIIDSVLDEQEWAAIVINPGATSRLNTARANGIQGYNGSSAIDVYYAQARNELAENTYLVPYIQMALAQITAQASAQSVSQYLSANSGNATAITLLSQAPATLSNGYFYTMNNLRPYNQPVANAITLVGLIYMLIFSFIIAMMGNGARELIAPFLTTKSYILFRLAYPLTLYMPVALLFAMVNLPFRIHFDAHFSYAGGFFLWAFTTYLGMCAMGLAVEFALTVVGPKFIGFFLVGWIIVNVSVVALPHELQPWIFRYGPGMPFYNMSRVVRTIIFDTKNEIGKNLGILIAWMVVSMITVSLATWISRRKAVNLHRKAKGEEERVHGSAEKQVR